MDYIFCSSTTFKVTSILTLPTLAEIESEDPRMAKIKVDPLFGHCPPRFIKAFEGCRENINKKCGILNQFPEELDVIKRNTATIKRELKAQLQKNNKRDSTTGHIPFYTGSYAALPCEDKFRYTRWLPSEKFPSSHLALCADVYINFSELSVEWDRFV